MNQITNLSQSFHPDPKKEKVVKPKYKGLRNKPREATGERELFLKIYEKRGGRCGITKKPLVFNVWCFLHILGKKAFPSFRLEEANILLVQRKIHELYDTSSKAKLLEAFPEAIVIYEIKEVLKEAYARNIKR